MVGGGCLSLILWIVFSAIIGAITESVWAGIIGGGLAVLLIAYFITKD